MWKLKVMSSGLKVSGFRFHAEADRC